MGRRKIEIQEITDPKLRNITYNKRKNGLVKKAAEISLLCGINLMLVFEDLNGTLVQFSRTPIKNIASFPKECHYKRVLELTADDYPNFSKIKRNKKKVDSPDEAMAKTPNTNAKKATRTFVQMLSEHGSTISKEDIFSTDYDKRTYGSPMDMIPETSTHGNYSEDDFFTQGGSPDSESEFNPEGLIRKAVKTMNAIQAQAEKNQKEAKKKQLRLNIPRSEETKEAMKGADSKGSRRRADGNSSKKLNSNGSYKNYIRRTNYDGTSGSKPVDRKMELTQSPYQFLNMDPNNPINIRLVNLMNSPYRDQVPQRRHRTSNNMMGEEDTFNPSYPELSPFNFPIIGSTPPILKQNDGDEVLTTEKIVNYLSQSGRSPPQQHNIFTFQQPEMQRVTDNYSGIMDPMMYGMDGEGSGYRKSQFWEMQLSGKDNCSKMDNYLPSGGYSGQRYGVDSYCFGNDERTMEWGDPCRRMKMN